MFSYKESSQRESVLHFHVFLHTKQKNKVAADERWCKVFIMLVFNITIYKPPVCQESRIIF
jgi:hypothetical protein